MLALAQALQVLVAAVVAAKAAVVSRVHQQKPTIRSSQFNMAAFLTCLVKVKLKALKAVSREFTLMARQFKAALALIILLVTQSLPVMEHRRKLISRIPTAQSQKKLST